MVALKQHLRKQGLSEGAIEELMGAWRESTTSNYASKCRLFMAWCSSKGLHPVHCTTAELLNWISGLSKLKASSRMSYLNAVTSLRARLGASGEDVPLLATYRRSLRNQGAVPAGPKEVPDLGKLFRHIQDLGSAPPERRKEARAVALVLLKLTTMARAFDMSWWRSDSVQITEKGLHVTAERTKGWTRPKKYFIPRCRAVPSLCPVAAFERYWKLYAGTNRDYVWRAVVSPFDCIEADTISGIVRRVIEDAGFSKEELTAHGLRNAGASIARKNGASLEAVKQQGGWKSWETMMNHYLHAGDFGNQVACAIYEDFDDLDDGDGGDEATPVQVS